jgi:hypothetical protein
MKDKKESALALFAPMWITGSEEKLSIRIYNVDQQEARDMLRDHWGTRTREALIEQIDRMSNANGHSLEYMEYHEMLLQMDEEEIPTYIESVHDETLKSELNIINTYKYDLRKCGGRAFDICRGQFLASIGFEAGYISEKEAWDYILATYDKYCDHFSSWEQYMLSYNAGRQYWSSNTSEAYAIDENYYRYMRLFINEKSLFGRNV